MDARDEFIAVDPEIQSKRQQLDPSQLALYWSSVSETMKRAFRIENPEAMIVALRERIGKAGPETQLFFYHRNPFQVAADLCTMAPTPPEAWQIEAYQTVLRDLWTSSAELEQTSTL